MNDKTMAAVSYGGAGASVGSALTLTDWGIIIGIVTALLTFGANIVYQSRRDRREQLEHDARMAGLLPDRRHQDVPVKQDRRQGGKISPALVGALTGGSMLAALGLVAAWESGPERPLSAYRDIVGVWTICDGITRGVRPGQRATHEECDRRLYQELLLIDVELAGCLRLDTPPGARAAAISLAYNVGPAAVCGSTMVRKFNAGDIVGGCEELRRWVYAGGKRVQGLANRREAERAVCLGQS